VRTSLLPSRFSSSRALAICRHEFRVLLRDPTFLIVMIGMPVVVMAFVSKVFRFALADEGYQNVTGAEQAVPGVTVMFTFFLVGSVGFVFFREHGWGTWERLRASRARPLEIMVGKCLPVLAHAAVQQTVLFGLGAALFGLRVSGSIVALVLVAAAFAVCLITLGVAVTSLCRTANQNNAVSNVGAMLMAGLGGAIAPISALPGWARVIAPGTPSYWAMRGFRSVILDGGGLPAVVPSVVAMLLFAAGFTVFSLYRFRFEETKISWA
jgi:ABC-2 type transport system permease protein